jgi:hypothetical protein
MSSIIMPIGIIKPPGLVGYWPLNGERVSGIDLFDIGAGGFETGPGGWVPFDSNTVEISPDKAHSGTKSLKVTYVDSANGARVPLSEASDLTRNLVIGKRYRATCWAAEGAGASLNIALYSGETGLRMSEVAVMNQTMTRIVLDFTCEHVTSDSLRLYNFGSGEVGYIDDISLQELYTPSLVGVDHGTVRGGVTPSPLGGYAFDGVAGSYIDLGPTAGDYTDNFSLMALINTASVNNNRIATRRDDTNTQWDWYLRDPSNDVLSLYDGSTEYLASTGLEDGLDHWITTVINGANSQHFVDGKKDGAAFSPSITSQSLNTLIGAQGDTGQANNWPGAIRKFAIFNRALTEAQIQYEMHRGSAFKPVFRGGVLWAR